MWQHVIKIQGLPWRLWCWNGKFYKTDEVYERSPVYEKKSYFLYGLIPISGVKILKYQGIWMLWRNADYEPLDIYSIEYDQTFPMGEWTYGITVY